MTGPAETVRAPGGDVAGLRDAEVRARLAEFGPNELPRAPRPSLAGRLGRELREPMAVLLLVAAVVSGALLGEIVDAVAIVTIVLVNAVIALVQEGRAERALEALEALAAPEATVVRGSRRRIVPAADLVPGDHVLVQAGDRVPADLDLVSAGGLEVDEAVLTGESLPVVKRPGGAVDGVAVADRDGRLHSGTIVTRGVGAGTVAATGAATSLGAIAEGLRAIGREPTPLQRQLQGLTRRLGLAAVLVAAATFGLVAAIGGGGLDEAFLTGVALAVAAVPEGLAAVTTVALALGVGRMARRGAIVRRLPAVETLGATDVLVIDKTGTVTENRMRLATVVDTSGEPRRPDELPQDERATLTAALVLCNDATTDPPTGDPMERALLEIADAATVESLRRAAPRLDAAPFTSERKRMGVVHVVDGTPVLFVKGAPETVLARCTSARHGERDVPFGPAERDRLAAVAEQRAARGERLLAVATRTVDGPLGDVERLEHDLTLLALVSLRDPPRSSAPASVDAVRAAGMTLLMATGDHPATAAAIAREVGVAADRPWTGDDLRERGFPDDPTAAPVYARVDPDQKLDLVRRLQDGGRTVAMTGDGVNDAPALRRADIGVALGATGSDVAREAADLVITDDDLATIVVAVREGRGIYDNLRKVIDYLVASNLAEVTVVVSTLLLFPSFGVPLFPLQLLWINLLTDGLPALALGVDPVDPGVMDRPPRDPRSRLLDGARLRHLGGRSVVLAAGAVAALVVAREVLDLPDPEARTVLFTTLVLAQVLYAFVVRLPADGTRVGVNVWLLVSAAASLGLHAVVVTVAPAQRVFDTVTLSAGSWLTAAAAGAATPLVVALASRQRRRGARAAR